MTKATSVSASSIQTIATKMLDYAQTHTWYPGAPLRPYRKTWEGRVEISFYIDAKKSEAALEIISRDGSPIAAADISAIHAAFRVPTTATKFQSDLKMLYHWHWTMYVQQKLFHEVKA